MLDSDDSSSSDGSPLPSPTTVQELQRQLVEAKQQASSELASAKQRAEWDLVTAQIATERLQKRCSKLEAESAELHKSLDIPACHG